MVGSLVSRARPSLSDSRGVKRMLQPDCTVYSENQEADNQDAPLRDLEKGMEIPEIPRSRKVEK
jgi:hypothetical protein